MAAVPVQEEAFGPLVPWVKGIHDDGLCAFDLTAAEWTTLTVGFLEETSESKVRETGYMRPTCG